MGVRCAVVTTPWDMSCTAGQIDCVDGIPVINTNATSPRWAAPAVREQLQWVERFQPQLIHLFKPKGFGGFAALLDTVLRHHSRPLVVDCDDWEGDGGWNQSGGYSYAQQLIFDWQERTLIARADAVTAASTLLYKRAQILRPQSGPDSVYLLPNGLPRSWSRRLADARAQHGEAFASRNVLMYSRFAEFPAGWLSEYAAALARLVSTPTTITVIGQGLPAANEVSNSRVRVNYLGYVARSALPDLLANASLAVYPYTDSLVTRSKQSVKLLELMAAGCPTIASDVGDIARTIDRSGVILPGADPEDFAEATGRLLLDPGRLETMSDLGRKRVSERFQFEQLAESLKQLYLELGLVPRW